MKKVSLLLIVCTMFVICFVSAAMAATLLYATDANGNATYGDIPTLIHAINEGKNIRFATIGPDGNSIGVFDAQTIEVYNGIVIAQNTSHVSIWGDGTTGYFLPGSPYNAFYTVNHLGDVEVSRWGVGSNTSYGTTIEKMALKWFAK